MATVIIDKLSFTGRLYTENGNLLDYLQVTPYENEYRHMPWNFLYQHQFHFKHDGFFIQLGKFENELVFRMEFNPNKIENVKFLDDILKRIKHPNITRIDWAVDYEKDLSKCDMKLSNPRKIIEYRGRSGKLETKYLGSPKSDKFIRVYNKALEMAKNRRMLEDEEEEIEVKKTLWRVESVVKNFEIKVEQKIKTINKNGEPVEEVQKVGYDYLFQNPFKELQIFEKVESADVEGLKIAEKAMLFYLDHFPEERSNLSLNTRKKYENLKYVFGYELMKKQPYELFEEQKNRLVEELESLLKSALDNTQYIIGKNSNLHYSLQFYKYQTTGNVDKEVPINKVEIEYQNNKHLFTDDNLHKIIGQFEQPVKTPIGNFKFIGDINI